MRFTLPGLMPLSTPVADSIAVTEVRLLGDQPLLLEVSLGINITGKELALLVENDAQELGEISGALSVTDAPTGTLTINFGSAMSGIVTLDTGHHAWVIAEVIDGVYFNLKSGTVYRTLRQA